MIRYVCPECGAGKNAPQRMRKIDVRRYCLRCSERTGVLVERTAPTLERKRAAAKTATIEKAAKKRAQQRAHHVIQTTDVAGVAHEIDVHKELRRALRSMGFFDGWLNTPRLPEDFDIGIRRRDDPRSSGRAYQRSMWVTFTFGTGYESALEVIYHEAAHMANQAEDHHGPKFRRLLADALQARWPFIRYGSVQRGRCYGADEHVVEQMREHVRGGGTL